MSKEGLGVQQRWKRARQAAPLLLLLLTGCGDDRPHEGPPPGPPPQARAAPAETPFTSASSASTASGAADPLIGNAGQSVSDPLIGNVKPVPSDPLMGHGSLQGPAMPTEHSHWLRGHLRGARVTVRLNGVRYGSFSGALDQDITMSLRRGANTVTFEYQPQGSGSTADLEIVESEHHPPIAPLVTFRSTPAPAESENTLGGDDLKPTTQTFPFMAN